MDSLLRHAIPQDFHLLPWLQCIQSTISMLGLLGFIAVKKISNSCQCISNMQTLIHGWNTPVITTANKQWSFPQQFPPMSQSKNKKWMRNDKWPTMNERMNKMKSVNDEQWVNPQIAQIWVYIFTWKSRTTWPSPRSSCNHFSQLKQLWVNRI